MTETQAKRMGFKPADFWDFDRRGMWVRYLQRPVCSETWNPKRPDVIERSTACGAYARTFSLRAA